MPGRLAQAEVSLIVNPGVVGSSPGPARPHAVVEIYHEIISKVILPLPLIHGQMSVSGESMCTKYWSTT